MYYHPIISNRSIILLWEIRNCRIKFPRGPGVCTLRQCGTVGQLKCWRSQRLSERMSEPSCRSLKPCYPCSEMPSRCSDQDTCTDYGVCWQTPCFRAALWLWWRIIGFEGCQSLKIPVNFEANSNKRSISPPRLLRLSLMRREWISRLEKNKDDVPHHSPPVFRFPYFVSCIKRTYPCKLSFCDLQPN